MRDLTVNNNFYSTNQPSQKWHSPRRYTPDTSKNSSKRNKNFITFPIKGISALSFLKNRYVFYGSMTLEAAIVLPLFLFFFINLLWIIEIYRLHSTLLTALRETGYQMAVVGYAYDTLIDEKEDSGLEAFIENVAFSEIYIRSQVEKLANINYLQNSPLTYGEKGLIYLETSILQQNDIIDLVVIYQISPFVNFVGFLNSGLYTRYYGRAWTGYDVEKRDNSKQEPIVYVAENGVVYHTERKCTYISLSIKQVAQNQVAGLHNEYGESYRPCEYCVRQNSGVICFITQCGNCYHHDQYCNAISRYIFQISYRDAIKKYRACPRCGR